jgi:predicted Zn-dependent peptidase
MIIIDKRNTHSVTMMLGYMAGPRFEKEGKHGIAHLVEHLLVNHSDRFLSKKDGWKRFARMSEFDGQTFSEVVTYWVKTTPRFFHEGLESLLSILDLKREFDGKVFETEKSACKGASKMYSATSDVYSYIFDRAQSAIYAGHPLSNTEMGNENDVESITIDDCIQHYEKFYKNANPVLALCGNIPDSFDEIRLPQKVIDEKITFSHHSAKKSYEPSEIVEDYGNQTTEICIANRIDNNDRSMIFTMNVANAILSDNTVYGKLFETMRTKTGIAYDTRSKIKHFSDSSALFIYAGITNKSDEKKAVETIKNLCDSVPNLITQEEIDLVKEAHLEQLGMSFDQTEFEAEWLIKNSFALGKPICFDEYKKRINEVTLDSVLNATKMMLDPSKFTKVIIR